MISNLEAHVIGWIEYSNTVDDIYQEYSVSWPENSIFGRVGPEWHEVDKGHQVVVNYAGDVDVETGDAADFVEFEEASEDNTLSVEIWDDGTEYSKGVYVEASDIRVVGYEKPPMSSSAKYAVGIFSFVLAFWLLGIVAVILLQVPPKISTYVRRSMYYTYVTSITGSGMQKANVYEYTANSGVGFKTSTDRAAKDIIDGIEGRTESVTQENDESNGNIAIVTDKEYCLIYHPENNPEKVYVQVSKRKYNYTSDNSPYKSSDSTTRWYRSHYYSSSYATDSKTYKSSPSAYKTYNGDTIHNIGNGYYDQYSSSVRQSSIEARKSSGGGLGGGK